MADKKFYVVHTKQGYWVGSFIFDEQLRKAKIYTSLHYAEKTAERLKYANADKYDPEIREVNICLADEKTTADVVSLDDVREAFQAYILEMTCSKYGTPEETQFARDIVRQAVDIVLGERKEQT